MLTFQDQYTLWQQIANDVSASALINAKRDINEGCAVFLNRLGRKFNTEYQTANLVANQQYYQFPSEVLRLAEAKFLNGSNYYTPELVTNELEWNQLNSISVTGSYPTHYYIRGFNELGVFPIPKSNVSSGVVVSYEPQHIDLTQADVTDTTSAGTLTVTNGAVAITHSAAAFTQQMVGRWLQITDGTDGKWYKLAAFVSTSVMNLENYYEGISGSGRTFRIGEISKIPQGYQDAPVYYALERYYLQQNDMRTAPTYGQRFDAKVKSAKETYGRSTHRMGVKSRRNGRKPSWIDLTKPVVYP